MRPVMACHKLSAFAPASACAARSCCGLGGLEALGARASAFRSRRSTALRAPQAVRPGAQGPDPAQRSRAGHGRLSKEARPPAAAQPAYIRAGQPWAHLRASLGRAWQEGGGHISLFPLFTCTGGIAGMAPGQSSEMLGDLRPGQSESHGVLSVRAAADLDLPGNVPRKASGRKQKLGSGSAPALLDALLSERLAWVPARGPHSMSSAGTCQPRSSAPFDAFPDEASRTWRHQVLQGGKGWGLG